MIYQQVRIVQLREFQNEDFRFTLATFSQLIFNFFFTLTTIIFLKFFYKFPTLSPDFYFYF